MRSASSRDNRKCARYLFYFVLWRGWLCSKQCLLGFTTHCSCMPLNRRVMYTLKRQHSSLWDHRTLLGKDARLCCVAIVLLRPAYCAAIEVCVLFRVVTTMAKSVAVLVRPLFHALYGLLVTKAGNHICN